MFHDVQVLGALVQTPTPHVGRACGFAGWFAQSWLHGLLKTLQNSNKPCECRTRPQRVNWVKSDEQGCAWVPDIFEILAVDLEAWGIHLGHLDAFGMVGLKETNLRS